MTEQAPAALVEGGGVRRFLTFRIEDRLYALPAEEVTEVIRTPAVARVPQGPRGLLGIGNLRGEVLPVASLRGLLGRAEETLTGASRALVLSGASPVALAVDCVDALVAVEASRIEADQGRLSARPGETLRGAFAGERGGEAARVLDIQHLLTSAFVQRARPERRLAIGGAAAEIGEGEQDQGKLITFEVAGQEFALALEAVREIVPAPEDVTLTVGSDEMVLGVSSYRDTLLPLFSLRALLGLAGGRAEASKIVVVRVGSVLIGLLVDRMRAILPADASLIEPTPAVLSARTGGESRIKAIYRAEGGRRLVSILSPDELFRDEVMRRLNQTSRTSDVPETDVAGQAGDEATFLVFRLGDDEFGLPIGAVDEVAQVPVAFTRLPRTPKFLEGVINLRGEVLPVVDQRRRFDMPPLADGAGRRLIVVRTERHRAGLIVDSVSEVIRVEAGGIEPAPDLTGETTRLVNGVINLEHSGRMVLALDPAELLSRAERGLLDRFEATAKQAGK